MELLRLRKERNLTQKEVANQIGIFPQVYSRYERNEYEPNFENLCRLADFFNVTTDELIGRDLKPTLFDDARIERPEILDLYDSLTPELQEHALAYLHGLADRATIQKTATFNVSVNEIRGIKQ